MAIRKSELYSKLWASCDELRGGMDASQYKDYVLVLLFIKYISDKYAGQPYAPLVIPEGASFAAMVALKGKAEIGDRINKEIIAPLVKANDQLSQSVFSRLQRPGQAGQRQGAGGSAHPSDRDLRGAVAQLFAQPRRRRRHPRGCL
jgi:type I restriction enzyme M protein